MSDRCEYLIIGTGAGGSVAGARLAEAGRDVCFLEEGGDPLTTSRDVSTWMRETYRNGGVLPILGRPTIPLAEARCVGGGTVINGALIWRTPSWILEAWEHGGLTGYDADALAPHFATVEGDLSVVVHELRDDADRDSLLLWRGAQALGWKAVMVPRAVRDVRCEVKQSAAVTYLPRAKAAGARIVRNARAVRIERDGDRAVAVRVRSTDPRTGRTEERRITCDHVVLAAGAVQTPHLLQRSGIVASVPYEVQFHANLKIVAEYPDAIHAHRGTIFTVQLQEFEHEGILLMATYLTPHFFALTLARHGVDAFDGAMRRYAHCGLYTTMVRMASRARVTSVLGDQPLLRYRFDADDLPRILRALEQSACALFAGGASRLFLPLRAAFPATTMDDVRALLARAVPEDLDMATVHIMASCPMGGSAATSAVRPDGRLWDMENVLVCDASVLPSNIGESPQGTIMAFVHEIMDRHLATSYAHPTAH